MTATELIAYEQSEHRRYFQRFAMRGQTRVCDIPSETAPPITGSPEGAILPGYAGAEADLLKPRITGITFDRVRLKGGIIQRATVTILQPVPYASGISTDYFEELRNSRTKNPGQFDTEAVVIGVCTDDSHADVPTKADIFPGDESAHLPRVCFGVTSDPNVIPGLKYITARYRGSVGV